MADNSAYWDDFYKAVLPGSLSPSGTVNAINPLDASHLGLGAGNGTSNPLSAVLDFLNPSADTIVKRADAAQNATPLMETVTAPITDAIAEWVPRLAVIVLGMVFVAAGLALFKSGPEITLNSTPLVPKVKVI